MKITVEQCKPCEHGKTVLVKLWIKGGLRDRRVICRIPLADYEAAGAPPTGQEIGEDAYLCIADQTDRAGAYERALQILATADNTARMLYRKLIERCFLPVHAKEAVLRCKKAGYIRENDMLDRQFAVFAAKRIGPHKYEPTLSRYGFSATRVQAAKRRAAQNGVYEAEKIKEALLQEAAPQTREETVKLLKKHGFL